MSSSEETPARWLTLVETFKAKRDEHYAYAKREMDDPEGGNAIAANQDHLVARAWQSAAHLLEALLRDAAPLTQHESRSPDGDGPCMRSDTRQPQIVPSRESEDRSVKGAQSGVVSGAGSEPADSHYLFAQAALRDAWDAGFRLCRSYGDNHAHFDGEQKERHWQAFLTRAEAAEAKVRDAAPQEPEEYSVCKNCKEPVEWHKTRLLYDCTNCGRIDGSALLLTRGVAAQTAGAPEVWWIALNGHGQIVGAYRTKEQAEANSRYIVGIMPDQHAMTTLEQALPDGTARREADLPMRDAEPSASPKLAEEDHDVLRLFIDEIGQLRAGADLIAGPGPDELEVLWRGKSIAYETTLKVLARLLQETPMSMPLVASSPQATVTAGHSTFSRASGDLDSVPCTQSAAAHSESPINEARPLENANDSARTVVASSPQQESQS